MTAEKKIFANQIHGGQAVEDIFMVKEMSRAETRSGKPYLIMTFMDRSGEIAGRLWENADAFIDMCEQGSLVEISAQAQEYRGKLQLKVDDIRRIGKDAVDPVLFIQSSKKNIADMAREIHSLAASLQNPFYRKLLLEFFNDSTFFKEFQKAPAAKSMHHAYLGGLLEHTLAVSQLAEMVSDFYPTLDRELLLAGALLHDIGKTREFAFDTYPFNYTNKGRLMGHLVLGAEMIQEKINTLSEFPEDLSTRLQHLVLSHHGRYEFGSPCLPMVSEAFVLNFIDDLDAKLNFMGRLEEQAPEPGYQWTDFQRTLERFLFINGRPHAESGSPADPEQSNAEDKSGQNAKQQQLF